MEQSTAGQYLKRLPSTPGIYLMRDSEGQILYVGKAKSLKKRVNSYFRKSAQHAPKIARMVKQVASIDFIETSSEIEALLLEAHTIQDLQPRYNTRQKDNTSYPYIVFSKEEFPRVFIARQHECLPAEQFEFCGPYTDIAGLRGCFKLLQKIFQFRSCELNISDGGKRYFRPCLLASIHYCTAPCAARITHEEYAKNIGRLKKFLHGNHKILLQNLQQEMIEAAQNLAFEEAARLRDQLRALQSLEKRPLPRDPLPVELSFAHPRQSLLALQEALHLPQMPHTIEGIDIAHHSGREAVGSLVAFVDGVPYKEGYRRYRIRSAMTNDDYAMLAEVLRRRFCGQDKNRKPPDIFLVDGGKGQLHSVLEEAKRIGLILPAVVALAKQQEDIYIPLVEQALPFTKDSLVHRLLCHVRDEAHRFAQAYHHHLKSDNIEARRRSSRA
jgi:excinuclease ABC subunit C